VGVSQKKTNSFINLHWVYSPVGDFFISKLKLSAINQKSWIIPEVSRLPVDMLSRILYDKTEDVGMTPSLRCHSKIIE